MTIRQALTQVEQVKPNAVPDEVLVQWLNEVDQTIFKELVKTHEYGTELVFGGYEHGRERRGQCCAAGAGAVQPAVCVLPVRAD